MYVIWLEYLFLCPEACHALLLEKFVLSNCSLAVWLQIIIHPQNLDASYEVGLWIHVTQIKSEVQNKK